MTSQIANAETGMRHVFVHGLELDARIGIYPEEKAAAQRIVIHVDLGVEEGRGPLEDDIETVVSYETVVDGIKRLVAAGHVHLVETLAERIAQQCLDEDDVALVRVRVEKPDIIPEARAVGVEIERVKAIRSKP